jgi:hypothetical protein
MKAGIDVDFVKTIPEGSPAGNINGLCVLTEFKLSIRVDNVIYTSNGCNDVECIINGFSSQNSTTSNVIFHCNATRSLKNFVLVTYRGPEIDKNVCFVKHISGLLSRNRRETLTLWVFDDANSASKGFCQGKFCVSQTGILLQSRWN